MDPEKVDILDENGNPTGEVKLKLEAHEKGLWHRGVHVWIYNSRGEVMLQKRAKYKRHYPNLWDISAAGHVSAGQSYDEAATRELFEELGIEVDVSHLKKVENRQLIQEDINPLLHNREFVNVYLLKWDGDIKDLKLQKEEVERVRFLPLSKFKAELDNPDKMKKYVSHGNLYLDAIRHIRSAL
ncbi:NUDIX domain-containing protein [Candidatus Woesearchaeota archaeon]|nr:NUDIX domain-containing protein [Candidatus Woesearchaeota archaeon]